MKATQKRNFEAKQASSDSSKKQGGEAASGAKGNGNIKPDLLSSREEYVLYQISDDRHEERYGVRTGAYLRDKISHDDLVYSSKNKTYTSRRGKTYVIRRAR